MTRTILPAFAAASAFAAGWAAYLVHVHNEALAHTLAPGALCGPDGGCGDVLASDWSSFGGIAVSAPATPLFAALAVLALVAMAQGSDTRRLSVFGSVIGGIGLLFGGALLFEMLAVIGAVCRYCLVMDGATLLVTVLALFLHPEGPKGVAGDLSELAKPGPEWAVPAAVLLLGAWPLVLMPEPEAEQGPFEIVAEQVIEPGEQAEAVEPPPEAVQSQIETRRIVIPKDRTPITLPPGTPIKGPADAPNTIIVFEDFQCPFCRKLAGNLEALMKQRSDVKIAWMHYPMNQACTKAELRKTLHPDACTAARAGVCAQEQGQFWQLHDLMFRNNAKLKAEDIKDYVQEAKLDMSSFGACMRDERSLQRVLADTQIGMDAAVRGTPTFFINERRFSGAQPVDAMIAILDALANDPDDRVLLDVDIVDEVVGLVEGAPADVEITVLEHPFRIDTFEGHIVDGKAISAPGATVTGRVNWYEAKEACEAAGKRLCTEREWLAACTGAKPIDTDSDGTFSDDTIQGNFHPYGDYQQESWCASSRRPDDVRPLVTGTHPRCATPTGIYDMEGLTKEWIGLTPDRAGLKGGSFYSQTSARCGYLKDDTPPDQADGASGIRCCSGSVPEYATADHHPGGKVGDTVMDFSLKTVDGRTVTKADILGKPTILTFWASWCQPCRKELPALAALYEQHKADGLQVIGINVDKQVPAAKAYLKRDPLPFTVALDSNSELFNSFDSAGMPTTFWITKSGVIRQRSVGYDERRGEAMFEQWITELMLAD